MRKLMATAALALTLTIGMVAGWQLRETQPVGHAVTEDSTITGMDYRDGAWYVR